MQISDKVKRSAWWMIPVVLLVLAATVVPAVAGITYNPSNASNNPAGVRLADQPRTCFDPYNCTSNSGGDFSDGEPAIASGANGATHYLYSTWTADRQGNEDTALVPYGSFNSPTTKNCTDSGTYGLATFTQRTITGATWVGSTITFTVSSTHVFLPGDVVKVSGVTPAGYNSVSYTVLASPAPTATTFAVTNAGTPAAYTSGGTAVRVGNCSQVFFARAAASRPATTTVAVTAASWGNCGAGAFTGKCITYTAAGHGLTVGSTANVFGVTPSDWNYSGPINSVTANTIEVPAGFKGYAAPAAYGSGGVVYKNSWAWDGGASGGGGGPACVTNVAWCNQYGRNAFPVSPSNQHVEGMAIAASGAYVYVMWTNTIGYYSQMCQNEPRVLWVRVNSHYGDADAWGPPIQLSPGTIAPGTTDTGKVDYPSIAAMGNSVYVIHTNSDTGDIILDESTNNGGAWTTKTIGHTFAVYDNTVMVGGVTCPGVPLTTAPYNSDPSVEGYEGMPMVAATTGAAGGAVAAAWQSNDNGKIVVKISTDNGATWPGGGGGSPCSAGGTQACTQQMTINGGKGGAIANTTCPYTAATPPGTVGACMPGNLGLDANATRVGVAFMKDNTSAAGPSGVYYRQWSTTTGWAPKRLVGCFDPASLGCGGGTGMAATYNDGFAPSVALFGTSGAGINFSACQIADASCTDPEVLFKETGDGVTFHDGCPAGTPCGKYQIIANNNWNFAEIKGLTSAVNDYSNILFDNPSVSGTTGCASQGASSPPGLPVVGCKTDHYFIGRNSYYTYYRMYIVQGTQT